VCMSMYMCECEFALANYPAPMITHAYLTKNKNVKSTEN
jgi:hypothetical protein